MPHIPTVSDQRKLQSRVRLAIGALATAIVAAYALSERAIISDQFPVPPPLPLGTPPLPVMSLRRAFAVLDSSIGPSEREHLRVVLPESLAVYGPGLSGVLHAGFLRDSAAKPLVHYLVARGRSRPDDMATVVLYLYGGYLRDHPVDIDGALHSLPPLEVAIPTTEISGRK